MRPISLRSSAINFWSCLMIWKHKSDCKSDSMTGKFVFLLEKMVRTPMNVFKSLMILISKMPEFLTQTYMIQDRCKVRRNRSYNTMDPQLNRLAKLAKTIYNSLWVCLKLSSGFTLEILNLKILQSNDGKVCVLNLVQLEDDIGYFKSSHTDLLSSNWTRSKTQTLILTFIK